jgi:hypothetical protein
MSSPDYGTCSQAALQSQLDDMEDADSHYDQVADQRSSQGPAPAELYTLKQNEIPVCWLNERIDLSGLAEALRLVPIAHKNRPALEAIDRALRGTGLDEYRVPYVHGKQVDFGRRYAKGPSLQCMSKLIKNVIVAQTVQDFDIVRDEAA